VATGFQFWSHKEKVNDSLRYKNRFELVYLGVSLFRSSLFDDDCNSFSLGNGFERLIPCTCTLN